MVKLDKENEVSAPNSFTKDQEPSHVSTEIRAAAEVVRTLILPNTCVCVRTHICVLLRLCVPGSLHVDMLFSADF